MKIHICTADAIALLCILRLHGLLIQGLGPNDKALLLVNEEVIEPAHILQPAKNLVTSTSMAGLAGTRQPAHLV